MRIVLCAHLNIYTLIQSAHKMTQPYFVVALKRDFELVTQTF